MTDNDKTAQAILKFLSAYFDSSIKVTFFLTIFKLLGITHNSWWWTTFFLWIPLGLALGCIVIHFCIFYIGFFIGCTREVLKKNLRSIY